MSRWSIGSARPCRLADARPGRQPGFPLLAHRQSDRCCRHSLQVLRPNAFGGPRGNCKQLKIAASGGPWSRYCIAVFGGDWRPREMPRARTIQRSRYGPTAPVDDNWQYQRRLAESLIASMEPHEAIRVCHENGWEGVLGVILALQRSAMRRAPRVPIRDDTGDASE